MPNLNDAPSSRKKTPSPRRTTGAPVGLILKLGVELPRSLVQLMPKTPEGLLLRGARFDLDAGIEALGAQKVETATISRPSP